MFDNLQGGGKIEATIYVYSKTKNMEIIQV